MSEDISGVPATAIVYTTSANSFIKDLARLGNRWGDDSGHLVSGPSSSLLRRLERQKGENAIASCPNIRNILSRRHIGYGPEAVSAAVKNSEGARYRSVIIYLSLPIVSADGKEAVFVRSFQSAGLFGAGKVVYMTSGKDGKWKPLASAQLWVS